MVLHDLIETLDLLRYPDAVEPFRPAMPYPAGFEYRTREQLCREGYRPPEGKRFLKCKPIVEKEPRFYCIDPYDLYLSQLKATPIYYQNEAASALENAMLEGLELLDAWAVLPKSSYLHFVDNRGVPPLFSFYNIEIRIPCDMYFDFCCLNRDVYIEQTKYFLKQYVKTELPQTKSPSCHYPTPATEDEFEALVKKALSNYRIGPSGKLTKIAEELYEAAKKCLIEKALDTPIPMNKANIIPFPAIKSGYSQSASLDADALYTLGKRFIDEGEEEIGCHCIYIAACGNHPAAQYAIYQFCMNGMVFKQDRKVAREWLKLAAQNGHSVAQKNLT
mgnify:CR=1 FL=1